MGEVAKLDPPLSACPCVIFFCQARKMASFPTARLAVTVQPSLSAHTLGNHSVKPVAVQCRCIARSGLRSLETILFPARRAS